MEIVSVFLAAAIGGVGVLGGGMVANATSHSGAPAADAPGVIATADARAASGAPGLVNVADARPSGSPANVAAPAGAATHAATAAGSPPHPCLATGDGYLRAHIRGALKLDVDLHNAELECDGGPRPDGRGIRVSFAGPVRSDGRRLRIVFGVATATEGAAGRELPTNLTVIFEGEQRLFATLGDDKCTVDQLSQERMGALGGPIRSYRVIARGFCIAPAKALNGEQSILVNSFDFAGCVTFTDPDPGDTVRPGGNPEQ